MRRLFSILFFLPAYIFSQTYPSVSGNNGTSIYINTVEFNTINNNSGGGDADGDAGYDFFSNTTTVTKSSSYTLSVDVQQQQKKNIYITAWFDWNDDGDFTDAGEEYVLLTNSNKTSVSQSITIPTTASSNNIRLRISYADGNPVTHSGNYNNGETEDYEINIASSAPNPEPSNHATAFTASAISDSQIDLSWTDASGGQLPIGYIIKANTTGSFTNPVDGTDPAEDTDLSDGSALVKVNYGVESYSFSSLNSSTQYYFKIWPYTNTSSDIDFKIDGTVPTDNETTLIKNVYVNKDNNCVTINEIEYEVLNPNGTTKYIQTSSGSGSNPSPTNVAVNILRISIDESTDDLYPDNTIPTLSNFNSNVGNTTVNESDISVIKPNSIIEHHDGSTTNTPAIDNPPYFSSLADVVGITDMRSYFNLGGNVLNNSEGFMDVLYDKPIIEGDIVFVSERWGNTPQSFTPLDINGNPIPGAAKVTIGDATKPDLYQWDTKIENSTDPNGYQTQWVIGFCGSIFYDGNPNIGPVYGWRINDLGIGADGKILLFRKDSDLSLIKTVDDNEPSVGNNITFTISVTNNGPTDASGVKVSDQLPTGLTYVSDNGSGSYNNSTGIWTIGDLANGNSTSLTITTTVTEDALPNVTNTACISYSEQYDSDESNNCDDVLITPENEDSNPLPIELLSFDTKTNDKNVDIKWTTASELNNNYFEVQRSKDGLNFETIETIDGAGNSNKVINYQTIDYNPISGVSYYRIKQTDFDGSFSFSDIKAVNFSQQINIKIYPNQASDILNIQSSSAGIIEIRNQNGSLVYKTEVQESNSKININEFASGVYILRFISNENIEVMKLIKR